MTRPGAATDVDGAGGDYRGKRTVDLMVAAILLAVTAPVQLIALVAVRLSSPGPGVHRAVRVGRDGQPFTLYKLRSMYVSIDRDAASITVRGDPRVTPVGRVLRRWKIDELPQLVNVVAGDMSIVGPRPEDPRYVVSYSPEQRRILQWRPGLTSPASVSYRHEELVLAAATDLDEAYETVMADKITIDLDYFPRSTLTGDVRWVARTVRALVGAHRPEA